MRQKGAETMTKPKKMQEMDFFKTWVKEQGIPVIGGYYVEDVTKVPVAHWDKLGGSAAHLDLVGGEEQSAAFIWEIPAGGSLNPQRHLYEEFIYVVSGRGTASVWYGSTSKRSFEWRQGDLFAPPLNAWYQLTNSQRDKPVRMFVVTGAPVFMNLFHNYDFIFNNDFEFKDRYHGEENYFSNAGTLLEISGSAWEGAHPVWETNFLRDTRTFDVPVLEQMGGGGFGIMNLELSQNTMEAHISQFPSGSYKKGHRHDAGAFIIHIAGKGYSFLWYDGEPKQRFDWREGTILVPGDSQWHQHFSTGKVPARQLALRWHGKKFRFGKRWGVDKDVKAGGDQIEYWDEDPDIRQIFEAQLAKEGLKSKMDPNLYRKGA